ncbi:MAG: hypothetical protein FWC68_02395 [Oscillospiraceae bacterium]|nr:hypothetical protein [Oscillospiraceae bacterium]
MLTGMMLTPIFTRRYEKKKRKKYERDRQEKYREYIQTKTDHIDDVIIEQRKTLLANMISAEECQKLVMTKNRRVWERKIEEHDFLTVRLGTGDIPLNADVAYPEEEFAMLENDLMEIIEDLEKKSKTLRNVPVSYSMRKKNISALIVDDENVRIQDYVKTLIMQLVTFHSPEDLKFVFLMNNNKEKKWNFAKKIPHVWSNNKDIRFFADNYDDMQEISMYLGEILRK